jgi:hypothetical protein
MDQYEIEQYKAEYCVHCCVTECKREDVKVECCEAQDYADMMYDREMRGYGDVPCTPSRNTSGLPRQHIW